MPTPTMARPRLVGEKGAPGGSDFPLRQEGSDLWSRLVRFLADPKIPLDTNGVERALRGVAVGRKNHYGSRSERGTRVARRSSPR